MGEHQQTVLEHECQIPIKFYEYRRKCMELLSYHHMIQRIYDINWNIDSIIGNISTYVTMICNKL